ncbi:MAG: hypothetical protein KDE00_00870 [Rhodobacteraceae bacterium]|nr:hypothetical protein [Paracoccaceae bacterium]
MTASPPPARRRDAGRIVLIVALAVSLLFNAIAAGAALRAHRLKSELLGPDAAAAMFPRDIRRDIARELAGGDAPLKTAIRAAIEARRAVVDTAAAEPFDRAATEAAMADLRVKADAALAAAQGVVLDALTRRAARD